MRIQLRADPEHSAAAHAARPASSDGPRIAVIGGGVAGLVAARDLVIAGARVTVFERGARLGGRIRDAQLAGVSIDVGAEAFATRGGSVHTLIAELGLAPEVVRPAPLGSWAIAGDRALPLPLGGVLGIPARPLSASARSSLGVWASARAAIEPLLPKLQHQDRSLAEIVTRRLGPRVLERLVRPVALGVYSAEPEALHLRHVPGLAAAVEREGSLVRAARSLGAQHVAAGGAVAGLRGGMTTLITALAHDLRAHGGTIHTEHEIDQIDDADKIDDADQIDDASKTGLCGQPGDEYDGVLIAVPQPAAVALLDAMRRGSDNDQPAVNAGIGIGIDTDIASSAGTAVEVIVLAVTDVRLDDAPRGTGVLVAPGTPGISAKALTHVTAKWPGRAAASPGTHILRLSYGRAGSRPETETLSDADARDLARRDASRILGFAPGHDIPESAVRDMVRQPWILGSVLGSVRGAAPGSAPETPLPHGIALAGDWVHGTGLASVIPGARRAARALLDSIVACPVAKPATPHSLSAETGATDMTPPDPVSTPGPVAASAPGVVSGVAPDVAPRSIPAVDAGITPGRVTRVDGPIAAAPGLIRIGTRGSALAVTQTTTVARGIAAATGCDVALVIVKTKGDLSTAPLAQLGGTGVFVSALREALLANECDLAVHSLKDLPTGPCEGIVLGAIPVRADSRDALCGRDGLTLALLPAGAKVGTGSPRRAAQLLARRPDLEVCDLRGNVDTRLARVGSDLDAVVLAAAGLDRIGRSDAISERFDLDVAPAAPGQGALAIEVRAEDVTSEPLRTALEALNDPRTHAAALAERCMLGTLEAGCAAPIGAAATVTGGVLALSATVYSLDGREQLTATAELPWSGTPGLGDSDGDGDGESAETRDSVPERLGRKVAAELLDRGAAQLAPLGNLR